MMKSSKAARLITVLIMALAMTAAYMPHAMDFASAAEFDSEQKVQNLRVSSYGTTYVNLKWDAVEDATGYCVYKKSSENGKYQKIKDTTSTSYKRTGLTTDVTCWYKVKAYKSGDEGKTFGKYSSVVKGTPKLNKPKIKTLSNTSNVRITWEPIDGATGYRVYRATSKDGTYKKLGTTKNTSFKNLTVDKGTRYYYKVKAYKDSNGKTYTSYFSTKVAGTTKPPVVTGVKPTADNTGITIKWDKVVNADGYYIQRKKAGGEYEKIATTTSRSYKDTNVSSNEVYTYRVRAYYELNDSKKWGKYSSTGYSRDAVVAQAVSWLNYKEPQLCKKSSDKSNKEIVDIYNKNMGTKWSYTTPWCAMYVSAVAIKTETTNIILRGSYCPDLINQYKKSKVPNYSYGSGSKYKPSPGDVIYFDWNKNGVPDHTGLVAEVNGNTVKTIEGNKNDMVGYRTFSVGYSLVQGYGLPNYDEATSIKYTGTGLAKAASDELKEAGMSGDPNGYSDIASEYDSVEKKVFDGVGCGEETSEYDKMKYMIKKVRAKANTSDIECTESEYYASFIYKLCREADMDASIMTIVDENGKDQAWVEVMLDGTLYKVDASKKNCKPEKYKPEATDFNPAAN